MGIGTNAAAMQDDQEPIGRHERRAVSMRGFAQRADESSFDVQLLDLSYDGCGIEATADLQVGEIIQLSVLRRGVITARVCWCKDGKAGLVFLAEADPGNDGLENRDHDREPFKGEALVRRLGGHNYQVQIFDVSPEGCRIEVVETPRMGEHLMIKFNGLEAMDSEVCWLEGKTAGLRYTNPMHPAVYDLLMQRLH